MLRRRHRKVEEAWRHVHTVSCHGGVAVASDDTKRIVREVVVINEAGNCKLVKRAH